MELLFLLCVEDPKQRDEIEGILIAAMPTATAPPKTSTRTT